MTSMGLQILGLRWVCVGLQINETSDDWFQHRTLQVAVLTQNHGVQWIDVPNVNIGETELDQSQETG